MFITVFTTANFWSCSEPDKSSPRPSSCLLRCILMLSFHPCLTLPSCIMASLLCARTQHVFIHSLHVTLAHWPVSGPSHPLFGNEYVFWLSAKNKIKRIYHRPITTTKIRMVQLKACSGASVAFTTKIPAALIMVLLRVWKHSRVLQKGVALWLTVVHSKICGYIMSSDNWSASSVSHSDDLL